MIISVTFVEFHNFLLGSMPIKKISAAFWCLWNFRNFSFVIRNLWRKMKASIPQLPKVNSKEWGLFGLQL